MLLDGINHVAAISEDNPPGTPAEGYEVGVP